MTSQTIPATLDALRVPLDELRVYPRNPRRGDTSAIAISLQVNGQYRPLVVNRRSNEILAGNHTFLAARELGWREIAVTYVDVDDETAARIVLVDNRTADLAAYDDSDLAQLLDSLDSLDGTAWSDDELQQLLASIDDDGAEQLDDDDAEQQQRFSFGVYSREQLIDTAFADYRASGFPYRSLPLHVCMNEINRLAAMGDQQLQRTNVGYAVADTYHPHRYEAKIPGKRTALETFASDRYFRIAIEHVIEYNGSLTPATLLGILSLTRGTQASSNFRPGYALSLLRRYAPDDATVLDCSAGYGGRLIGFLASRASTYVGIDPAAPTHVANERLRDDLCPDSKSVELHCVPAEDVPHDDLRERCDFALTSPPYFCKEQYTDEETQSFRRYPQAEQWRDGFLRPLLELQHAALKRDAFNVLNIADVKIDDRSVPLVEWALQAARDTGFEVVAVEELQLTRRWGPQADEITTEPVLVMRK